MQRIDLARQLPWIAALAACACATPQATSTATPTAAAPLLPPAAAAPSCAPADCNTRAMAALGEGRPADALALLDRACSLGHAVACSSLAGLLRSGGLGAKDPGRALGLYDRSCRLGFAEACTTVGGMLAEGTVVPADPPRALAMFEAGCARQDAAACFTAGIHLESGRAGKREPERAAASFVRSCELGHATGCFNAGVLLYREEGARPGENERAAAMFGRACEGAQPAGCLRLGLAVLQGVGAPPDAKRAAGLFGQACEGGDADGCAAKEQLVKARGRTVAIALTTRVPSFTIRGFSVRDLACRMTETDPMAVAEVVDGLAGQRAALDACAPGGAAAPVSWSYRDGKAGQVRVEVADAKVAACVRKAVAAARASQTASCSATLLIGAPEGAQRELAALQAAPPRGPLQVGTK